MAETAGNVSPDVTANGGFMEYGNRKEAAELVAQDRLTDAEIALQLGIAKRTLERWKNHSDFALAVQWSRAETVEAIRKQGIAHKQNRLDSYRDDFALLDRVIAERAEHYDGKAPGGGTGLIVGQLKLVKHIDDTDEETGQRVWLDEHWEYVVDTGLLAERRHLRKQMAQELGEWTDKSETKHDASEGFLEALRAFGRAGAGA